MPWPGRARQARAWTAHPWTWRPPSWCGGGRRSRCRHPHVGPPTCAWGPHAEHPAIQDTSRGRGLNNIWINFYYYDLHIIIWIITATFVSKMKKISIMIVYSCENYGVSASKVGSKLTCSCSRHSSFIPFTKSSTISIVSPRSSHPAVSSTFRNLNCEM